MTRAAVLGSSEGRGVGGSDDYEPLPRFSSERERKVEVRLVVLPDGIRAAGIGRGALRPSSPDWGRFGLGQPQVVKTRVPGWLQLVLANAGRESDFHGYEIPGPIDVPVQLASEGIVIDVPATVAELEVYRDVAKEIWKREEGWLRTPRTIVGAPRSALRLARSVGSEWREAIGELKTPTPPGAERPAFDPVGGVEYATWVQVEAGLARDRVHPAHADLYASHRGVPAGRWPEVDAAWRARAQADAAVAAWAAYDGRRMRAEGARW